MMRWGLASLLLVALQAAAAPRAVPTFHSIGLYWSPEGGSESEAARVEFREPNGSWRQGLDLWFDARNNEYRGSLVELKPGTQYEIRLTAGKFSETTKARTWSEKFPVKRTVQVPPGTTHFVINAADSGDENGYVVFTGGVIDQAGAPGNDIVKDNCVVVKQGVHHVIIRGLKLQNCKRAGIMFERQHPPVATQTHDVVIEDNEFSGWGGFENQKPNTGLPDNDAAVQCNYYRETDDARRPDRIIVQRNVMRDPRHSATPWMKGAGPRRHPEGPQGVLFAKCGTNHVIRYNEIYTKTGKYFMDGIGGAENFSAAGFPYADSDIYGNRISHVYDDGIEAEGANRNVRIWGNWFDQVFVAIGNAATATGPLYVWRNVSHRMANMYHPDGDPDAELRGPFIKAGSNHAQYNGGRAYYFHNTILQPPGKRFSAGAGWGIFNSGGRVKNVVSRNNIWHIHNDVPVHGRARFHPIGADRGAVEASADVHRPVYASSGRDYPELGAQPGNFQLRKGSPGYGSAEPIPNFNDAFGGRADAGAHQSGQPPMRFGREAASP